MLGCSVAHGTALNDFERVQRHLQRLHPFTAYTGRKYQASGTGVVFVCKDAVVHSLSFGVELGYTFQRTDDKVAVFYLHAKEWPDVLHELVDIPLSLIYIQLFLFLHHPTTTLGFQLVLPFQQAIMLGFQVLGTNVVGVVGVEVEVVQQVEVIGPQAGVLHDVVVPVAYLDGPRVADVSVKSEPVLQQGELTVLQQYLWPRFVIKQTPYQRGGCDVVEVFSQPVTHQLWQRA